MDAIGDNTVLPASGPVTSRATIPQVIRAVAGQRELAVLDSARDDGRAGRYTMVACNPVRVYDSSVCRGDPFERMRGHLAATGMLEPNADDAPPPAAGCGWIGYFAYEAGRYIERMDASTAADIGLPLARFGLYDSAAIYDHAAGTWSVATRDFGGARTGNEEPRQSDVKRRLDWWRDVLASAEAAPHDAPHARPFCSRPSASLSREQFMAIVERAREYIAAGDIFQVNLARRESIAATESPVELYLRLRRTNPGAYSALLAWNSGEDGRGSDKDWDCAVLCSSPELFLQAEGREIVTRPIKGTRPRSDDPAEDEALRQALAASVKDRAELAMIVDLERNDLGRVCEYGSIRVVGDSGPAAPYAIETHPTVHHLVATVAGRLAPGRDAIDLLRATFPGGSITGAPKVRAMQIIDELEPVERSVYTGSIGCFGSGGSMAMNIAIRTMIQARGRLHWYAGGGMVADSTPEAEFDETCAKALGMRRALGLD